MKLAKVYTFNGNRFNCYVDDKHQDLFWATGKQFGTLLGYAIPSKQVRDYFRRLKRANITKGYAVSERLVTLENGKKMTRQVSFYGFRLLRQICETTTQENASDVKNFLLNIAAEMTPITKSLFQEARLSNEVKISLAREYVQRTTGQDVLDFFPKSRFTAKEIADILGTSPSAIGNIALRNGLKAPLGTSNAFGEWGFIGSVPHFFYNGMALSWFKNHLDRR